MNGICEFCQAFPIDLVLAEKLKENSEAIMNTRLSNDNFQGEIQKIFDSFINRLK